MGLASIEGYLLDSEQLNADWGRNGLTTTLLIKLDSPLESITDVQSVLPAYDNGVTAEPTFTIGYSYYPGRTDLLLKSVGSVREHPAGRPWWLIELQYEASDWLNKQLEGENQGRGKVGKKKRINETTGDAIVEPWNEPPTWSSGVRSVQATRWHDASGKLLRHTNDLPVTEGITYNNYLETHTFTWNLNYATFDYDTDIKPYIGKINDASISGFKTAQKWHVLCENISCTENYRTVNVGTPSGQTGGSGTFHYITVDATFIIDRRTYAADVLPANQYGYFIESHRRVSMHTVGWPRNPTTGAVDKTKGHVPIDINDAGVDATSPWPLDPQGRGIYYKVVPAWGQPSINTADPLDDFGWIDPGLPEEADLTTFATTHSLVIP